MTDRDTARAGKPPGAPAADRREYVGLVIALNAVGAGVSFLAFLAPPDPDDAIVLWILFFFTAPFAVGSLLAMWAAFGGKSSPWRLLAVVVPPARPFRRAGFRLTRRRTRTAPTELDATVNAERDPWTDDPGRG